MIAANMTAANMTRGRVCALKVFGRGAGGQMTPASVTQVVQMTAANVTLVID